MTTHALYGEWPSAGAAPAQVSHLHQWVTAVTWDDGSMSYAVAAIPSAPLPAAAVFCLHCGVAADTVPAAERRGAR